MSTQTKLKAVMDKKNMKPLELAYLSGISQTTVFNLLSDESAIRKAKVQTVLGIAKALDVSIEELLGVEAG